MAIFSLRNPLLCSHLINCLYDRFSIPAAVNVHCVDDALVALSTRGRRLFRIPFVYLGIISDDRAARHGPVANVLLRPFRLLGLWKPENAPSVAAGFTTALISTFALVGLWPLLHEIGLNLSLATLQPISKYTYTWNDATRSMVEAFSDTGNWLWVWRWELWS